MAAFFHFYLSICALTRLHSCFDYTLLSYFKMRATVSGTGIEADRV